jgi:hypothetical protein
MKIRTAAKSAIGLAPRRNSTPIFLRPEIIAKFDYPTNIILREPRRYLRGRGSCPTWLGGIQRREWVSNDFAIPSPKR